MAQDLVRYRDILEIVGDILRVRVPYRGVGADVLAPRLQELALVETSSADGAQTTKQALAQVIRLDRDVATLQVFGGTAGLSTGSSVRFLGHPMRAVASPRVLGRIFRGTGEPIDGKVALADDISVPIGGPSVNPVRRDLASRVIRTDVPMIDLFNTLVESQKIPIFSVSGEPYDELLARVGVQADADVVVFGGIGLTFDNFHMFRSAFEAAGVSARTVMYVNLASDPVVERLLVPDMALAVAERIAHDENKRVLVLLTDMTAFADALKEIAVAMDRIPSNRGYTGDLYSQLARRYEKACDFRGAGSVTILTVTTMPGGDVTHPVPDNTGYITEGQLYLHDGVLDPFGSLSRLKQLVIGKETREDHGQLMNAMIRLYAGARDAQQKQAMAFELSAFDGKLLRYGTLFRERFMNVQVKLRLEDALDLGWRTLAECFAPDEVLIKRALVERFWPREPRHAVAEGATGT
jgi:V/A-type H+-transporting ATPase subunit B